MTKRLILMRHAKSSWNAPLADHERTLNARGRRSAEAVGHWLRERSYHPDQAFISTSMRTRETFDLLKLDMPEAATHYKERLYHAAPEVFFNVLKSATGQAVLIIAHNPGIAEFAERVAKTRPQHIGFEHYPTCATWVADFDIKDWSALQMHSGRTTDFCVPREL